MCKYKSLGIILQGGDVYRIFGVFLSLSVHLDRVIQLGEEVAAEHFDRSALRRDEAQWRVREFELRASRRRWLEGLAVGAQV